MSSKLPPVAYSDLALADLATHRTYRGGPQPHVGADPLHPLVGVGNSGGFRAKALQDRSAIAFCVLFSTGAVSEWPDGWSSDGDYVYYGDQRKPGLDVLETPRKGNQLLADIALLMKRGERGRSSVPPLLLFEKDGPDRGRDVRFEGLLVPASTDPWLTVERRTQPSGELSNYRALLSPLPVAMLTRAWLTDIRNGCPHSPNAPDPWIRWVKTGTIE